MSEYASTVVAYFDLHCSVRINVMPNVDLSKQPMIGPCFVSICGTNDTGVLRILGINTFR